MLTVKTHIAPSTIHGIGIFADEFIPKGKIVWVFHPHVDLALTEEMILELDPPCREQVRKYSYFDGPSQKFILCGDDARHFNHAEDPNCDDHDTQVAHVTVAARDIQEGEELTCNYSVFDARYSPEELIPGAATFGTNAQRVQGAFGHGRIGSFRNTAIAPGRAGIPESKGSRPSWRRWLRPFSMTLLLLAGTTSQATSKPPLLARQEASSASGPTGGPIAPAPALPGAPEAIQAQSPIREISSEDALAAFTAKTVFLDARSTEAYDKGHVRGAWNLPVASAALDEHLVEFEVTVRPQPDTPLVVYCSGPDCPDSHNLATKLFQLGYRKILIYVDGFPDWAAKKRPVDQAPAQK